MSEDAPAPPASSAALDALATLRERGLQHADPVRFHGIEALARRAAAHVGEARRVLDERLATLLAAYAEPHDDPRPAAGRAGQAMTLGTVGTGPGPLAELLRHIDQPTAGQGTAGPADPSHAPRGEPAAAPSELKALRQFRATWSRLSVEQQLSRSLARQPAQAGPLNSHRLVLRTLETLHALSPDYLQGFMSYVDALSWLDQANAGNAAAAAGGLGGERDRKRGAARPRSDPTRVGGRQPVRRGPG